MKYFNSKWLLIALILASSCNLPRKESKVYTFKDVGWTMTLPAEFKTLDSTGIDNTNQRGKKLMEHSTGTKLDISSTQTLISAKKGNATFSATITPFDTAKDGGYTVAAKTVKDMLYKTFSDQMPGATLDSASEPKTVGGLEFDCFHVTASVKSKPLFTVFVLAKFYKGYDFGISYLYTDAVTKTQIDNILSSSKFQ